MTKPSKGTVQIGFINKNGQVVVRATGLPGTDHVQYIYQLACSGCGENYGANGSDIHLRKCPHCQQGEPGLPFDTGPLNDEADLLIYGQIQDKPLFLPVEDVARYVRIFYALHTSQTWGDFEKKMPTDEIEALYENDERLTLDRYCTENDLDPDDPESRDAFIELDTSERRFLPEEEFHPQQIYGYEDGDWPSSFWSCMLSRMPAMAISACGGIESYPMGGEFPRFGTEKLPMLKHLLQQAGFRCMLWQEMIDAATSRAPEGISEEHFAWLVRRAENLAAKSRWFKRTDSATVGNLQ